MFANLPEPAGAADCPERWLAVFQFARPSSETHPGRPASSGSIQRSRAASAAVALAGCGRCGDGVPHTENGTLIDGVAVGKVVAPPGASVRIGKTLVQLVPADEAEDRR